MVKKLGLVYSSVKFWVALIGELEYLNGPEDKEQICL